jgi:predicted CxxxxCH...CXXCH cytochrome family protein
MLRNANDRHRSDRNYMPCSNIYCHCEGKKEMSSGQPRSCHLPRSNMRAIDLAGWSAKCERESERTLVGDGEEGVGESVSTVANSWHALLNGLKAFPCSIWFAGVVARNLAAFIGPCSTNTATRPGLRSSNPQKHSILTPPAHSTRCRAVLRPCHRLRAWTWLGLRPERGALRFYDACASNDGFSIATIP